MKLRRMTEAWMEAFALGSVVLVPLFFNPYSARAFEGDKACLLYLMAIGTAVSLGLWLLLGSDDTPRALWGKLRATMRETPLLGFIAVLLAAWFLSQIFSISPGISFRGSHERMHGTRTILACACILAGMLVSLRSQRSADRFLLTIIFTSIPVVACGILQRPLRDPNAWMGDDTIRVTGTMGNPIFLGAWIGIVFFLTLARTWTAIQDARAEGAAPGSRALAAALFLTCIAQLVCLYLTGSRGPLLATAAGAAVFAGLLLVRHGRRKTLYAMLAGGAILAAGVLATGGAARKFTPAGGNMNRIARVADTEGASSRVRILIWKAAAQTVFTTEPLAIPDAGTDRLAWLRPLIGFGPETIASVIRRNYEPELGRLEAGRYIDRSHNATWDLLMTHGLLGTLAFFALVGAGVAAALARLTGTRFTTGQVAALTGIVAGTTILGAMGAVTVKDVSYLGLGAGGGFAAGILLALPYAISLPRRPDQESGSDRRWPLSAGLAAALVSHVVEIQFSVPTISTTLYSWIVLGLLCVESRNSREPAATEAGQGGNLVWGLIGALAFVSIDFSFCAFGESQGNWQDFFRNAWGPMVIGLALCVTPALYLLSPARHAQGRVTGDSGGLRGAIAELGPGVVALILGAGMLSVLMARLSTATPHNYGALMMLARALGNVGLVSCSVLLLLVLAVGTVIACDRSGATERPRPAWSCIGALLLGVVVWVSAQHVSFMPIQADMCLKQGENFMSRDRPHDASGMFARAMALAPDEELYAEGTAQMYAKIAYGATSETEAVLAIRDSIKYFEYALLLNPSRPDHYANLARAYAWWSGIAEDTDIGRQAAQTADSYMEQGLRLTPRQHGLWEERAQLNMGTLGRPDVAEACLKKALELDPGSERAHALTGEFLGRCAVSAATPAQRIALQRSAVEHFEAASHAYHPDNASFVHRALARLYFDLGNVDKARESAGKALSAAANDDERQTAESMVKTVGAK